MAISFQQFLVLIVSHFGIHLVVTVAVHFGNPSLVATALSAIKSLKQGRVDDDAVPSTHISLQFEFDTSPHSSIIVVVVVVEPVVEPVEPVESIEPEVFVESG